MPSTAAASGGRAPTRPGDASSGGGPETPRLPLARVFRLWWPLMLSWALMGVELPLISGVLARLPDSKVQLAATGGLVYPIALLIEAPIIMLLSASTALVADRKTERWLRMFTLRSMVVLTVVHALVACTPLYDVVVATFFDVDARLAEAGRLGLILAIPWPGAIAWRRYRQGILIAQEHSGAVGKGTVVRLVADLAVLGAGLALWSAAPELALPGAALAGAVLGVGTIAEAVYAEWRVRPVVRERLAADDPEVAPLRARGFAAFYVPLALTPLLGLAIHPMGAATISRMPAALDSLACWGPVYGIVFVLRAPGFAFQEVVVSFSRRAARVDAGPALVRAALLVGLVVTALAVVLTLPWTGGVWFRQVAGLDEDLIPMALTGAAVAAPMPGLAVALHLAQGRLVAAGRTREVTFGVVVYFAAATAALWYGATYGPTTGLPWALGAFLAAAVCQVAWLGGRAACRA